MKKYKHPVYLWAMAGVVLSLLTLAVIVFGIHSTPTIAMDYEVVVQAASETLDCVRTGDYEALSQLLYGAPNLGESPEATEDAQSMILFAFLDSIQYQVSPQCRASDSGITVDVHIQCLDIAAVSEALQAIVPDLMTKIANEKGDESLVYDANHDYLESFLSEVLATATKQVLAGNPTTTEKDITLELVQSGGKWQVVPTEDFVQLLTGYVSQ